MEGQRPGRNTQCVLTVQVHGRRTKPPRARSLSSVSFYDNITQLNLASSSDIEVGPPSYDSRPGSAVVSLWKVEKGGERAPNENNRGQVGSKFKKQQVLPKLGDSETLSQQHPSV